MNVKPFCCPSCTLQSSVENCDGIDLGSNKQVLESCADCCFLFGLFFMDALHYICSSHGCKLKCRNGAFFCLMFHSHSVKEMCHLMMDHLIFILFIM